LRPSSVGHFDYSGDLDTCIAIRTMVFKDGVAYLQGNVLSPVHPQSNQPVILIMYFAAGGGIVYDSVEEDEYHETMNKMGSNLTAIAECELKYYEAQQEENQ
jgi:anthranilate synthase component I